MTYSDWKSQNKRALAIDFDLYSAQDDEFKNELISLLIQNLIEVNESLEKADQMNDLNIFLKATHKMKTMLAIVNDSDFIRMVDQLRERNLIHEEVRTAWVALFKRVCSDIIFSLQHEILCSVHANASHVSLFRINKQKK